MKTNIYIYIYMIISRSIIFRIRTFSDKSCRENQNAHFMFNSFFNRAFHEVMWKNIVKPGRPQMSIWCTRIACWIPKDTNTRSEYVILTAYSTATKVARPRLNIMLYVYCLSCWSFLAASTAPDTVKNYLFRQNLLPNSSILYLKNKIMYFICSLLFFGFHKMCWLRDKCVCQKSHILRWRTLSRRPRSVPEWR